MRTFCPDTYSPPELFVNQLFAKTAMDKNNILIEIRAALENRGFPDSPLVELADSALEEWNKADAEIQRLGIVLKDGRGSHKSNPAIRTKEAAEKRLMGILRECGLTPSGQKRVGATPEEIIDPTQFIPDL